jgi:hypothetical protein
MRLKILFCSSLYLFFLGCATGPSPELQSMQEREKGRIGGGYLYEMGNNEIQLEVGLSYAKTPQEIQRSYELVASFYCAENFKKGYKVTDKKEEYTKVVDGNEITGVGMTRVFFECYGKPSVTQKEFLVKIEAPIKFSWQKEMPNYKEASSYPKNKYFTP